MGYDFWEIMLKLLEVLGGLEFFLQYLILKFCSKTPQKPSNITSKLKKTRHTKIRLTTFNYSLSHFAIIILYVHHPHTDLIKSPQTHLATAENLNKNREIYLVAHAYVWIEKRKKLYNLSTSITLIHLLIALVTHFHVLCRTRGNKKFNELSSNSQPVAPEQT